MIIQKKCKKIILKGDCAHDQLSGISGRGEGVAPRERKRNIQRVE